MVYNQQFKYRLASVIQLQHAAQHQSATKHNKQH